MPFTRDQLGIVVRNAWVQCAKQKPGSPPHHLAPFEELDEWNQEVDRRIGEAVLKAVIEDLKITNG